MEEIKLNDGVKIPQLGFGTWKLKGDEAYESIMEAIEIGYRHIDTAQAYGNHFEVGKAVRDSNLKREKFFITSKVWHSNLKYDDVIIAGKQSLEELDMDYLDLFLIHWPNHNIKISETLEALMILKEQGLVKSIGVSNFTVDHLKEVLDVGIQPSVNQVEYHPTFNQEELKAFCNGNNIVLTAYSPLGQGDDLKLVPIKRLAKKYEKTTSQIIIKWLLSKDLIVIPRSSNKQHIKENFDVFDFNLKQEDRKLIDDLDENNRQINPSFGEFDYSFRKI